MWYSTGKVQFKLKIRCLVIMESIAQWEFLSSQEALLTIRVKFAVQLLPPFREQVACCVLVIHLKVVCDCGYLWQIFPWIQFMMDPLCSRYVIIITEQISKVCAALLINNLVVKIIVCRLNSQTETASVSIWIWINYCRALSDTLFLVSGYFLL